MKKIIVIGCPGAGKSCFSKALSEKIRLPLYHLDLIWHKSDKTNITTDEFDQKLMSILATDKWIIDGNYNRTLQPRFEACDMVFFLDFPTEVCLSGVESRMGTKREDMPWVEEEFDPEFRDFIVDFPKNNLPKIQKLLSEYKHKNIIVFKTRAELKNYIESL